MTEGLTGGGRSLPVVIAAREHKLALASDDLGAQQKIAGGKAVANYACVKTSVPAIGNLARVQRSGFTPVGLVVFQHLAPSGATGGDTGLFTPRRVILHAVGRIGDHQVMFRSTCPIARERCATSPASNENWRVGRFRRRFRSEHFEKFGMHVH